MLGILFGFIISWLLLYVFEKKSILALGFLPFGKRFFQFISGFLITGFLCVLAQLFESYLQSSSWDINDQISSSLILNSFWWDFKSVLTEELIFRGAILYILIHKIGNSKSILISAIAFGVYHWFSYGILGNILPMVLIFLGTGLMGYAWALAFAKTKSIMLPFGLHLGWNFVYNTVFSKGPLGETILISSGGKELSDWVSLLNFSTGMFIVPAILIIYVHYFVAKEKS